ncbi:putative secondary metabolism biosynthetic enzyme [Exserohilum turcicum]|uniref:Methyltransferase type 12 domain-containing protein n=1 Tax=Exserohilum turcicum (strain 28A) TaxID=671987 RepID=R0IS50_EXST2|nr:uncharacterized protein SETTUDRAFT_31756 [Exserohilum turcica Et28A]EOA87506.1 hypothetical protein SETTUDRAFT_31756 [Exserohilum turcica Et28A]
MDASFASCNKNGRNGDASSGSVDDTRLTTTAEALESMVIPLQSDQVGISPSEKFNCCSAACARYISWAVQEIQNGGLVVKHDYRIHWWRVLDAFVRSEQGQTLIGQSPDTKEGLEKLTCRLGVEGEAISKIGPNLVGLLTGQIYPLFLLLKDDLLFRIYRSDEGARPNRYVAEYVKQLVSQAKRKLRILEIGAGTGGTTFQVLQACSPCGEAFCDEYMYTDISPNFFKTGESTLKKWQHLLTFRKLDIESNVAGQGFQEHAYDVVITANAIHATRSLTKSLGNIHKLLKPGGILGLVELTRLTPYFNMVFGSLPGWWHGVDEGRVESPLQSAEQWNEQLRKSGFSGTDLVAFDLPKSEGHIALLISHAL